MNKIIINIEQMSIIIDGLYYSKPFRKAYNDPKRERASNGCLTINLDRGPR